MAAFFRTLGRRTLSAVVFVALLLGCLYWSYYSFSVFFLAAAVVTLHEVYGLAAATGAKPYRTLGLVSGVCLYLGLWRWEMVCENPPVIPVAALFTLLPLLFLARALWDESEHAFRNAFISFGGVIYAVAPFALLHQLVIVRTAQPAYTPVLVFGIILLIWCNDTFAYLWGSLLGKTKLFERISPGKTWEGTILGMLTTIALGFLVREWDGFSEGLFWPVMGFLVPVLATVGDLSQSHLKRLAGVKDSGRIMPGHGGVLDRFDSLLFVAPVVVAMVALL
jgi:phosphatidate cytidylyltransferase